MTLPTVAVIAFDQFSAFHFSVPCIIFDDILPDMKLFNLRICAGESGPLRSSHGLTVEPPYGLEGLSDADIIVVPFWRKTKALPDEALLNALREAHQRGAQIVGLCLGTYVLAYAGLLNNRRASTHWEFEQDFKNRFPDITLDTHSLYVEDGNIMTSAGTAAGLDCCLYLLRQRYGSAIANKVARRMVIPPHRDGGQAQFIERPVPATTQDARMNSLLEFLRNHLHLQHDLDSLADRVMMTRRTFTRQFHKATGVSAGEWLLSERLQRSQELLETTTLPVESVASQAGFTSATSLRDHFKRKFNVTPSEWRRSFQIT
ncbi:helix-turn-helix domain-containing protein [Photobacterium galatheae]|uniref:AraC family transcriptional regulator n=1 Tax=Photobacterium galatheae TaxID=1654360 RepID=A0A066RH76_9GAMM|nr:helix-turn-helix domain-containing protein [Photobacterium galatheae]KDM89790.1 AraC family transcriptional regulator [Photobacterium galatheae]MCM0151441.1 helix-turn-helix domain-containing protein [Photobacterium galatheae]